MLILVLSVIASPEGKVYLKLSSNVKNEEKVNKETVTLGLISILVEVSKKDRNWIFVFQEHKKQQT